MSETAVAPHISQEESLKQLLVDYNTAIMQYSSQVATQMALIQFYERLSGFVGHFSVYFYHISL